MFSQLLMLLNPTLNTIFALIALAVIAVIIQTVGYMRKEVATIIVMLAIIFVLVIS